MGKRRIAISAGHSNVPGQDMGASSQWITEGIEAVNLRDMIVDEFKRRKEKVNIDSNSNVTFKTVALFKQYFSEKDIVLDIHFNAATSAKATGTECVIPDVASDLEKKLASDLAITVANTLGITFRGVIKEGNTPRKKLLWMTIPAENILLEVCFVTNRNDCEAYARHKIELSKAITDILLAYRNY